MPSTTYPYRFTDQFQISGFELNRIIELATRLEAIDSTRVIRQELRDIVLDVRTRPVMPAPASRVGSGVGVPEL